MIWLNPKHMIMYYSLIILLNKMQLIKQNTITIKNLFTIYHSVFLYRDFHNLYIIFTGEEYGTSFIENNTYTEIQFDLGLSCIH